MAGRYSAVKSATPFTERDVVVYRVKVFSSKGKGISAKVELRWSKILVIGKILKPNVVLLANV